MANIFKKASSKTLFLIQCFQTSPLHIHITYQTHTLSLNGWEYNLSIFDTINNLKGASNKQHSTEMEMESTLFIYSVQSHCNTRNNIYYLRNIIQCKKALTLTYGSEVPPMSRAGSSVHWMVVTFSDCALKSYSS